MDSSKLSFCLLCLVLGYLTYIPTTHSADPDPLEDICIPDTSDPGPFTTGFRCKPLPQVVPNDFFFGRLSTEGDTNNVYGVNVTRGDISTFPGLNTIGISIARVDFAVGGVNRPHTHPRGSEMVLIHSGKILVGFVTCSNQLYSKVLTEGEVFVIPRGLMHFQWNVGEGKATYFAIINSQSGGLVSAPLSLFGAKPGIPDFVLARSFLMEEGDVQSIKTRINASS